MPTNANKNTDEIDMATQRLQVPISKHKPYIITKTITCKSLMGL